MPTPSSRTTTSTGPGEHLQCARRPDPASIFQTLVGADDPLDVGELCDRTDLGTTLVSHHLQCLKDCQLVDAERDGRRRYHEVSRPEAVDMLSLADDCLRQRIESVLGCEVVTETVG